MKKIIFIFLALPLFSFSQQENNPRIPPEPVRNNLLEIQKEENSASEFVMAGSVLIWASQMIAPKVNSDGSKSRLFNNGFLALGSMLAVTGIVIEIRVNRLMIRSRFNK